MRRLPCRVLSPQTLRLLVTVVCAALFGAACAGDSSTQVVVLMDTDYAVPAEVSRIRARVSKMVGEGAAAEEVETWSDLFSLSGDAVSAPGTYALPATFGVLAADGDIDREIIVELEALASGSDAPLVSRRVKTRFVAGETRLVRMVLYQACEDVACDSGQTCGCSGAMSCATPGCIDETVAPEDLETIDDPGTLPPDAGIPIPDASLPDASIPDAGTQPDGSIPPEDGGTEPDGSVPDGGGITCGPPLTVCGADCVNTEADPRYCGDCDTACPSGSVCEAGTCFDPGDCRTDETGCTGFTYCEESTGECLAGCIEPEQCEGDNEVCDVENHECVCAPGLEPCAAGCVDTQNDPSFCGDCSTSCLEGFVCDAGACLNPGDCRNNGAGCSGFTYCDAASGDCLRGCELSAQCPADNEVCDLPTHECVCAPGFHPCGNACVSSSSVDTCGTLCTPCDVPPNAVATCEQEVCGFECEVDYELCDAMCCPTSCPPGQALYAQSCAAVHLQTADDQGNRGEYSSIALDSLGLAHVAHYAKSGRDLIYSEQGADASWTSESPDGPDDVGKYASIAIDGAGGIHVAYRNDKDKSLMLASRRSDGDWTIEVVDDQGDVGEHVSLALDTSNAPHLSYYDKANKDLMYATRTSTGAWRVETVDGDDDDDATDVGQYTSLALGTGGAVHISYYATTDRNLKYATRQGSGPWAVRSVDTGGDVGKYTSLAIDPKGAVHISYYGESDKDLLYATKVDSSTWVTETVESNGDVGKYTSLAFDSNGTAHLSYYGENDRDLRYAVQQSGQPWAVKPLDTAGDVGRYTSIAIDALGQAHISYNDQTGASLKYALVAAPE